MSTMLDSLLKPYCLPKESQPQRIDSLYMMPPGSTILLTDIDGPGCIRHFFITLNPQKLRDVIIRITWDDEDKPSVEIPLPDFFGAGHDLNTSEMNSLLFYNAPHYGFNCYIPMPFATKCKMEIINQSDLLKGVHFTVSFDLYSEPLTIPWRFHAGWRRAFPGYRRGQPLTLLEAKGEGRLLGVIYHVVKRDSDDRWSHGGADQTWIDGDTPNPTYLYGTGGENFAHHAWGLQPRQGPYSGAHHVHPVPGVKRAEGSYAFEPHAFEQHDGGHYSMYRFFIPDPIHFKHSIRMGFGTCENEISATTYWYQSEPHTPYTKLPAELKSRHYGERIAEDDTYTPLTFANTYPVAVFGPVLRAEGEPWKPGQPIDTTKVYDNNLKQAYGDTVKAPYQVRWRKSQVRAGFIDMSAMHRPKGNLRARGIWPQRGLPVNTVSSQLIRILDAAPRTLILRVGFEDESAVWLNGHNVANLNRPQPKHWILEDVKLTLKAGTNDIIIDNIQRRLGRWSAWGLYLAFLDENKNPVSDLKFETFESLDPTPERWREPWPEGGMPPTDNFRDPAMLV
jgi:hypothetical protein